MKKGLKKFLSRVRKGYKKYGEGFWQEEMKEANSKKLKCNNIENCGSNHEIDKIRAKTKWKGERI